MSTNNHNGRHISAGQKVGAGGGVESRQKRLGFLSFGFQNRRETSIHGAPQHSARNMAGKSLFLLAKVKGIRSGSPSHKCVRFDYSWLDNGING